MTKQELVDRILAGRSRSPAGVGEAFAPANVALCKYWGKRDETLHLPETSSLSVSLGTLGARTRISPARRDGVVVNGTSLPVAHPFAERLLRYLDLFRKGNPLHFHVTTWTNLPIGAGVASSAAGFAALVLALDRLFGWGLSGRELSILARLGSGSACRSIHRGFVRWDRGNAVDGSDSFARPLPFLWPALRVGLCIVSAQEKRIGSSAAMRHSAATSPRYAGWLRRVPRDLSRIEAAIAEGDFERLGRTAEANALAMHAVLHAARPPIRYWTEQSVALLERVRTLRREGLPLYATIDAGPNVKLLFQAEDTERIRQAFPGVKIVCPFAQDASCGSLLQEAREDSGIRSTQPSSVAGERCVR